ncbi:cadmium transporter, partial [Staphylococcus aureus]|nr:cadmium transporter [Staphylococcus aureus]
MRCIMIQTVVAAAVLYIATAV